MEKTHAYTKTCPPCGNWSNRHAGLCRSPSENYGRGNCAPSPQPAAAQAARQKVVQGPSGPFFYFALKSLPGQALTRADCLARHSAAAASRCKATSTNTPSVTPSPSGQAGPGQHGAARLAGGGSIGGEVGTGPAQAVKHSSRDRQVSQGRERPCDAWDRGQQLISHLG